MTSRILLTLLLVAAWLPAQSNAVPGVDIEMMPNPDPPQWGGDSMTRVATRPTEHAYAISTTSQNVGTLPVEWFPPMYANHPFIAFLLARESGHRFEQISDYSYVKHGFYSTNSNCAQSGGNFIFPNCTDTYSVGNNANAQYLGPPSEIDPWLGTWNPVGSHFDRGEPDVGAPQNTDGLRSLDSSQAVTLGSFVHRIIARSADVATLGASYYYQGQYVVGKEPEAARWNNLASWPVTFNLSGQVTSTGAHQYGTVLQRWSGARVESAANEVAGVPEDGRFYVGVKVVDLGGGMHRYEYAVHNRDNHAGALSFSVPVCSSAQVVNAGFKDIDADAGNDWSFTRNTHQLVWTGSVANKLAWNSIFNFWFDCDVAAFDAPVALEQTDHSTRAKCVQVVTSCPLSASLPVAYGAGCSPTTPPVLAATGPAIIPNPAFALEISGVSPASGVQLVASPLQGNLPFAGCTFLLTAEVPIIALAADSQGIALIPISIENDASLQGLTMNFQAYVLDPAGGTLFGIVNLSNGLAVTVGC